MATRVINEFFPSVIFFQILISLLIVRPELVWVNQIGVRIPRTIIPCLNFFRIKTIQTHHDFSVISPRKLYPANLIGGGRATLSSNRLINILYTGRRKCLIQMANLNFKNICISEIQYEIYRSFGVRSLIQLPNGIQTCKCKLNGKFKKIPETIFFAGRTTGKGLENVCKLVKANPTWRLVAAGGLDVKSVGLTYLDDTQFNYLGFLNPKALYEQIHKSDFVAVLSECFDVYPTIGLEAFMHNSIPITTPSTGITQLIRDSGCGIIVDSSSQALNLSELKQKIIYQPKFPIKQIELQISGESYLEILESAGLNAGNKFPYSEG